MVCRIDQLEKRQTQDDAVINVINRYWNQLNEDIRILLQRFDAETGDELEKKGESEATTSFLTALSTWHKQELDEKLSNRVQVLMGICCCLSYNASAVYSGEPESCGQDHPGL